MFWPHHFCKQNINLINKHIVESSPIYTYTHKYTYMYINSIYTYTCTSTDRHIKEGGLSLSCEQLSFTLSLHHLGIINGKCSARIGLFYTSSVLQSSALQCCLLSLHMPRCFSQASFKIIPWDFGWYIVTKKLLLRVWPTARDGPGQLWGKSEVFSAHGCWNELYTEFCGSSLVKTLLECQLSRYFGVFQVSNFAFKALLSTCSVEYSHSNYSTRLSWSMRLLWADRLLTEVVLTLLWFLPETSAAECLVWKSVISEMRIVHLVKHC